MLKTSKVGKDSLCKGEKEETGNEMEKWRRMADVHYRMKNEMTWRGQGTRLEQYENHIKRLHAFSSPRRL